MKKIVTIGGGTGSYTVLSGLKKHPDTALFALVTMADDGGSTGRLRKKFNVMPPGDVRQCLVALSGAEFLNKVVWGHKIGNVLIALLERLTGDFSTGLRILSWIFRTKGRIIPITKNDAVLCVRLRDGTLIRGESNIDSSSIQESSGETNLEQIFYESRVALNPEAREAISFADYILIGPGNLYSSVVPNMITEGFTDAVVKSKAKVIILINLVNKQGHTMGWNVMKHIDETEKYMGRRADVLLVNNEEFTNEQKERYLKDAGEDIFIKDDFEDPRIIRKELLSKKVYSQDDKDAVRRSLIRHDPEKVAGAISDIIKKL